MKLFVPITKVVAEKREVWGRAVQEVPDRAKEIFDYASSVPNFKAWSAGFEKATETLEQPSLGNIRAMHGKVAAGKAVAIDFNDADKAIDICAKIVDDNEWEKVVEGVYTGFSIGGSYAKRWKDQADPTLTRYTANPAEISLVDLPCVPSATFAVVKADGASETKSFQRYGLLKAVIDAPDTRPSDLVTLAAEYLASDRIDELLNAGGPISGLRDELRKIAATESDAPAAAEKIAARDDTTPKEGEDKYGDVKFADPKNKKYPIDTEQHIRAAWNYINKQKNAAKYSADDLKTIKDRIVAAWKEKISSDGPPSADDAEKFLAFQVETLRKGMYTVSMLADLIQSIFYIAQDAQFEAEWEQDSSLVPEQLRAWLQLGAEIVKDMAAEEAQELVESLNALMDPQVAVALQLAAKGDLTKAGKRHSKADEDKIQSMHDTSVDLGAMCPSDEADSEKMAKAATERAALEKRVADAEAAHAAELAKVRGETSAAIEQSVTLTKQLGEMTSARDALTKKLADLEQQPAPGKGVVSPAVVKAVEKVADASTAEPSTAEQPKTPLEKMKAVHAAGGRPLRP